jgi:hypothetical protein
MSIVAIAPASARDDYVDIEKRLTAEQLRATGLDTLSPDQLMMLNQLLRDDTKRAVQSYQKDEQTRRSAGWFSGSDTELVTSTLVGDFRGWSRGTVLKLANGQRWQVTEGQLYLGKALTDPEVTLAPGMVSGWYLSVKGQNPRAKVKRID